ncbi:peptide deformylase [Iamia sp. SCSIO 61187]|uniref:peptide deformylase n=1 Tax=Iamia sp. SCSIO 61187 TaxID=2722752 RepID=UPI001C6342D8|nr:peptide deformylase [Iamia sp. SCSIO 61187]QYG93079.1 peptide deformylase [Iamia sp. SCSIO 61187]
MAAYDIRIIGDPVLREVAADVTDIDGALVQVVEGMVDAMYEADGLAVAAPQVGVRKRLVVYHLPDDPEPVTIVNPRIEEYGDDEWLYSEGCLSIPGLYWEIARPKTVHVVGLDLDGNDVSIEADELAARMYQHEIDHLDGVLMTERLDDDQRVEAKRAVRELMLARADRVGTDAGPSSLLP